MKVPVGVSNRHIHLSQEHVEVLFGRGYEFRVLKPLSQPGQYAAKETVTIEGPKGSFAKVRVLGPNRKQTQIEVSTTDAYALGISAPVRDSGDLAHTPGICIVGPQGRVEANSGVIIAARHIHFHPFDAEAVGVRDKDLLRVKVEGERSVVFDRVLARVHPSYALEMHIDTDEANASGVKNGDVLEIMDVKVRVPALSLR
jgi:putative phosphotransacetylase